MIDMLKDIIYNEKKYMDIYIKDMLNRLSRMFHYVNLPDSIPSRIFDKFLFENGNCIFTEYNGKFYVFVGGFGGILNEYLEPTKYVVSNPYLNLEKEFEIGVDCEIIRNDSNMCGVLPILEKYGYLQRNSEISLDMSVIFSRSPFLISGMDERTKQSADEFIAKLSGGDFSVIGDNAFLDSLKIHDIPNNQNIQHCIEVNQYIKASAYNAIGLDSVLNQKHERMNETEVTINESCMIPLYEDMLQCRKNAIERINKKYNLNIKVELASSWKTQKETFDNLQAKTDTDTKDESDNVSRETIQEVKTDVSRETNSEKENNENEN